jgi:predicted carbohydrate-binding protein with CBM5 and CBM33 domain
MLYLKSNILILINLLVLFINRAEAHGRMENPPARNSAWRFGFNTPPNYNDNELNCGGLFHQISFGMSLR